MKRKSRRACDVVALTMLLAGCSATTSPLQAAATDPAKAQITVLYDAFGRASAMRQNWGYAALIEYGGKRILFDTGNNPDILSQNAQVKGIDLSKLDFVVLSHRHGDHMGGMASKVKIYAPIVTALHDTFKVAYLAPGHCTGEPTFTALKESFADRYIYAGLGATFAVGTTPWPLAGARQGVTI